MNTVGKLPFLALFWQVIFKAANAKFYRFKMTIKDVIIDWNRQAPVVGIAVVGMLTGNVTAGEAFAEATT